MAHVLIIEDHQNISLSLKDLIVKEGHQVTICENLALAREQFIPTVSSKPDLIILDWMLPDGQGLDFLIELRKQSVATPVIFLTARAEVVDKVLGLEMGANDYLTKPFEPRELIARVRVQLRTKAPEPTGLLTVGSLAIDRIRHKVNFKGAAIELVKKEFDLLVLLAEDPEKVFSRDEILNKVWGYEVYPTTRTVDTHIMLLRQKIDDQLIETVRSVGYRLKVL
ncbi:response regulator transcription factor [Pseudobdellovibrio sp. HCB154]|uniref:response regulator transcription factor n=1 Tax=Pseudobdellovibrio sp. HCB154 TaxID=3386277 RepID=UPI0039175FFE